MADEVNKICIEKPAMFSAVPSPRSGHRCVADDRNLYVFGGFSPYPEDNIFCELWRYNLPTGVWSLVRTSGPSPTEVCSSCVLLDDGCIITYGGSGIPFGLSNSNKLHVFLIKESKWIQVEASENEQEEDVDHEDVAYVPDLEVLVFLNHGRSVNIPLPGYGQSMVLSPDKDLYIFAGTAGRAFFASLTRFQFSTKKWSFIPRRSTPFISPRYRHEAVTYGDCFYVFGGGMGGSNPSDVCELEEVPSFCFSTNEWEMKKCTPAESGSFPRRRRCHGCVLFQDNVYICGGYDGVDIFDDIWTLDMKSFKWSKFPRVLPYPVYFHSTAVTPSGCMLTFGGIKSLDPETDPRSNDLSCLWLTIPPLLDLSLKAVYSCIPNISTLTHDELLKIGIPSRLIPPYLQPKNIVPQCG